MNLSEFNVQELVHTEVVETSGGSFGHDAGVVLRFAWIEATEGYAAAVADYAINKVMCGC